jgi:hypothetical protein
MMLGLTLRPEFLREHIEAATTVLHDEADHTGAIDIPAEQFFEITYPAIDLQRALHAISEATELRPIVLIAERGRGKTHIMAALHHAFQSPEAVEQWAHDWQSRNAIEIIQNLKLRRGYLPITTDIHRRKYLYLWDVLFKNHPQGQFYEGQFVASNDSVPSHELIKQMLAKQPVALILDEFQSWFDTKTNQGDKAQRQDYLWAFSFIQVLSEIATERPDLLILVASVRNNQTDAYRQIHRNDPLQIDFREATARRDRQRLVLHRLFANRHQIPAEDIVQATTPYCQERFRLLLAQHDAAAQVTSDEQVLLCWPFSPELFTILEDQILRSSDAQGLRDLLRILVHTFRAADENRAILTLADFNIIDPLSRNVNTLIDTIAISGQGKLRDIAIRNYEEIQQAQLSFPDVDAVEMMSALWMRSFAVEEQKGATLNQLHVDMTHEHIIDDNIFNDALMQLIANSFNIHQTSESGEIRYIFREDENPRARLMARSKNNELFQDGQDITYLRNRIRYLLSPSGIQVLRVIVLGPNWQTSPWLEREMKEEDQPDRWEHPVLLVFPDYPTDVDATLGEWLVYRVNRGRNTIRYLLPDANKPGIFADADLCQSARIAYLADEWKDTKYTPIGKEFQRKLDDALEKRFTRVLALQNWNYQSPKSCKFFSHAISKPLNQVALEVDRIVRDDFFFGDLFEARVLHLARNSQRVGDLLDFLREPPGEPNEDAIVYLGTTAINEQLVLLAAQGKIALNINGTWLIRDPNESVDVAQQRLRNRGFVQGTSLREMRLGLPDVVAPPTVAVPPIDEAVPPVSVPNGTPQTLPGTGDLNYEPTIPHNPIRETGDPGSQFAPPPIPLPRRVTRRSEKRKPLQMVSDLEQWRLQPREVIPIVRLSINNMSVADLKAMLGRMSAVGDASLEIEIEEKES